MKYSSTKKRKYIFLSRDIFVYKANQISKFTASCK